MSKWSLECVKKIEIDLADFITKRMPTTPIIQKSNLYQALLTINMEDAYQKSRICIVNTDTGCFLIVKCNKCQFDTVITRIEAMYNHCREIERKIEKMRHN